METPEQRYEKLRKSCWNKAVHAFALSYIFDKKAQRMSLYTNLLKIFGIVVPVTVGATASGYGLNSEILKSVIALAIPLTIFQLIFSVLAVVKKWDDELAYAYEASQDLGLLSDDFKKLGNLPPEEYAVLDQEYELLNTRYKARSQQNSKHNIKEWEHRLGMRFALRQFQRKCVGCHETPLSLESTECDICGKYGHIIYYKIFKP